LNLEERNVQGLIKAARELYNKQEGNKVVSHGDIHTKNIVTLTDYNKTVSQIATKVDEFGVIDLDSMVLDYPQGDLADFWLHHLRDARVECGNYSFDYEDYLKAYDSRIREFGEDFKSERNELISYVLWCVKELFDPTRKDGLDIQQKARFYAHLLRNGLDKLGSSGNDLGRELKSILRKTEYRDVW
jgi:thiamine kinase-like enzyme